MEDTGYNYEPSYGCVGPYRFAGRSDSWGRSVTITGTVMQYSIGDKLQPSLRDCASVFICCQRKILNNKLHQKSFFRTYNLIIVNAYCLMYANIGIC